MDRKCPNCATLRVAETAQGVQLEVCPNCAGIWLNSDELKTLVTCDAKVIEDLENSLHAEVGQKHAGGSHLLCPVDQVLMDQYHYLYNSPILIHTCSKCGGFFINADELPLMRQWFENCHRPIGKKEELTIAMASDIAEHQAFLMRQMHLRGLFNTLRAFRPGWSGFFP